MLQCQQVLSVYLDWAPTLLLGHSMASCVKRTKNVVVIILSGMDKIDVDLVTDVHQHRKYIFSAAEIYIWLKVVPFNSCLQEPLSSNKSNKSSKATKRIFLHMEGVIYGFFLNLDTAELFPSTDSKDMF